VPREIKSVPQRLKPRCEQGTCGTAEAVPLSKTDFFGCVYFSVPQRLKPRCEQGTFGTAQAVPLSRTDFFGGVYFRRRLEAWPIAMRRKRVCPG
jgi:hypothetical protein